MIQGVDELVNDIRNLVLSKSTMVRDTEQFEVDDLVDALHNLKVSDQCLNSANALHVAISCQKPNVLTPLVALGADVNHQNEVTGDTPLHEAAISWGASILRQLNVEQRRVAKSKSRSISRSPKNSRNKNCYYQKSCITITRRRQDVLAEKCIRVLTTQLHADRTIKNKQGETTEMIANVRVQRAQFIAESMDTSELPGGKARLESEKIVWDRVLQMFRPKTDLVDAISDAATNLLPGKDALSSFF